MGYHTPQVSRRSVPIEVCGSPLLSRHRLVTPAQGEAASNISSSFTSSATLPGSPLRSSTSVLASLDKSILQIRDWLTLLEEMLKKDSVDISSPEQVAHLLQRQKNVLRELEQKKPQLDDLVRT